MANRALARKPVPPIPKKGLKRTTKLLKEAIVEAAERTGFDQRGKDGLVGYLMFLAQTHPKAYTTLLAKVLPMQLAGEGGGPIRIIDDRMSPREAAEAYADTLRNIPGLVTPDDEIDIDLDEGDYTVVDDGEG